MGADTSETSWPVKKSDDVVSYDIAAKSFTCIDYKPIKLSKFIFNLTEKIRRKKIKEV
jgi:hypothetical protein